MYDNLSTELKITGSLVIEKFNTVTQESQTILVPNAVVASGKAHIAQRLSGTTGFTSMGFMGLGTTAAAATTGTNPALGTEIASANYAPTSGATAAGTVRKALTGTAWAAQSGTAPIWLQANGNVVVYTCTFPAFAYATTYPTGVATVAITEAAIFNWDGVTSAAAGGNQMLAWTTFGTVTKTPVDAITITWNITIN